jgi:hypothetical protein
MNDAAMIEWAKVADDLGRRWCRSLQARGAVRLDADDLRGFLIDLWLDRGGKDAMFEAGNRGRLYNYAAMTIARTTDAVMRAGSICRENDDGEIDEDRLSFLSRAQADDDDDVGLDPLDTLLAGEYESENESVVLSGYIDELDEAEGAADADSVLAELFGVTDRSGRTFSGSMRREKIVPLIMRAARARGMTESDVKRLADRIVQDRRALSKAGARVNGQELDRFAGMFCAPKPKTSAARKGSKRATPAVHPVPVPVRGQEHQACLFP